VAKGWLLPLGLTNNRRTLVGVGADRVSEGWFGEGGEMVWWSLIF
jgi:hypothetical protein